MTKSTAKKRKMLTSVDEVREKVWEGRRECEWDSAIVDARRTKVPDDEAKRVVGELLKAGRAGGEKLRAGCRGGLRKKTTKRPEKRRSEAKTEDGGSCRLPSQLGGNGAR